MEKIEVKILEEEIKWTKKVGIPPKLEGNILMEFTCPECHENNQIREDITNYNGASKIYLCGSCDEKYLIELEVKNPMRIRIGDKEDVEIYKQMIPIFQEARGIKPQDKINLSK